MQQESKVPVYHRLCFCLDFSKIGIFLLTVFVSGINTPGFAYEQGRKTVFAA